MAGTSCPGSTETVPLSVHNEGPGGADVEVVVRGDGVRVHPAALDEGETGTVHAPAGARVEIHSREGTATSMASRGAFFVVREGRVLVAPD